MTNNANSVQKLKLWRMLEWITAVIETNVVNQLDLFYLFTCSDGDLLCSKAEYICSGLLNFGDYLFGFKT